MKIQILSNKLFKEFTKIIYNETGIFYKDSKKLLLSNRIRNRLKELKLETFEEYYIYLKKNYNIEIKKLLNVVTTNETNFFRHNKQFEVLKSIFIEELINKGKKKYFIWSAGCSSGEEPYSIAIILNETIPDIDSYNIKILGTDISNYMLEKGKAGIYTEKSLNNVPEHIIKKYFKKIIINNVNHYEINLKIKKFVKFKYLNLYRDIFPLEVDMILCRNVLIYFPKEIQKIVVDKFYNSLNKDGYFLIGASEILLYAYDKFIPVKYNNRTTIYKPKIFTNEKNLFNDNRIAE